MFKNHQDDNKQYQLQEEKFENLFGGWEIGLTEAVEKEKGKSAIIKYDKYEINGGHLIFNLIDCSKLSFISHSLRTKIFKKWCIFIQ